MERYYVNIIGITKPQLELAGFVVVLEDDEFMLLEQKGDVHLVEKAKPYLFIDDRCDADFLKELRNQPTAIPLGSEKPN